MKPQISAWSIKSHGYVFCTQNFLGQASKLTRTTRYKTGNVGITIKLRTLWEVRLASENAGSAKGYPVALPVVIKIPSQRQHINLDLMVHVSTTFTSRTTRFGIHSTVSQVANDRLHFVSCKVSPSANGTHVPILFQTIVKQSSLWTNFILLGQRENQKNT